MVFEEIPISHVSGILEPEFRSISPALNLIVRKLEKFKAVASIDTREVRRKGAQSVGHGEGLDQAQR